MTDLAPYIALLDAAEAVPGAWWTVEMTLHGKPAAAALRAWATRRGLEVDYRVLSRIDLVGERRAAVQVSWPVVSVRVGDRVIAAHEDEYTVRELQKGAA